MQEYTTNSNECCICYEKECDVFLDCNHELCYRCLTKWCKTEKSVYRCPCPICRELSIIDSNNSLNIHTYNGITIPKGNILSLQDSERDILTGIDIFPDIINDNIDIVDVEIGKKYFIIYTSSSIYYGTIYMIKDNRIYLKDVDVIIRSGRYFKSFPPNRIIVEDNIFIYPVD